MSFFDEGHNPFKVLPFGLFFLVLCSLILLAVAPAKNDALVNAYVVMFGLLAIAIILDYAVKFTQFNGSEVIDTATFEFNPERFPLQYLLKSFKLPAIQIMTTTLIISVMVGLLWGAFYYEEITRTGKQFIAVPSFFATTPTIPLLQGVIDAKTFNVFESSFPVGSIEEGLFTGVIFMSIWSIILIIVGYSFGFKKLGIGISMLTLIISAPIGGALDSYLIHSFAYGSNYYAYETAFWHFTIANLTTGITGNIFASTIAHVIHNTVVTLSVKYQAFQTQPF